MWKPQCGVHSWKSLQSHDFFCIRVSPLGTRVAFHCFVNIVCFYLQLSTMSLMKKNYIESSCVCYVYPAPATFGNERDLYWHVQFVLHFLLCWTPSCIYIWFAWLQSAAVVNMPNVLYSQVGLPVLSKFHNHCPMMRSRYLLTESCLYQLTLAVSHVWLLSRGCLCFALRSDFVL